MGFVDHHQGNVDLFGHLDEFGLGQALGRDEHDLVGSLYDALQRRPLFLGRQGAVQLGRLDAQVEQFFSLVFHQGNQWRNHDGGAGQQLGGNLVAQRFAAAGRHDGQGVLAIENTVDHVLLAAAQALDVKHTAQQFADGIAAHGAQALFHQLGVMFCHSHNCSAHV